MRLKNRTSVCRCSSFRYWRARHEAGQAYVAWKTGREPKFITIVSRGVFGGYVSYGDGEESNKILEEQMNCAMNLLEEGQQTLDRVACDVTKPRKWYVVLRGQKNRNLHYMGGMRGAGKGLQ